MTTTFSKKSLKIYSLVFRMRHFNKSKIFHFISIFIVLARWKEQKRYIKANSYPNRFQKMQRYCYPVKIVYFIF